MAEKEPHFPSVDLKNYNIDINGVKNVNDYLNVMIKSVERKKELDDGVIRQNDERYKFKALPL